MRAEATGPADAQQGTRTEGERTQGERTERGRTEGKRTKGQHTKGVKAQGEEEDRATAPRARGSAWGGVLLGLGLGGFFDGILLHQVLQWHHLVSGVVDDPGMNILWDGVFHALMFVLLLTGVIVLWGVTRDRGVPPGRWLVGWVLLGAGVFHLVDAFVFHWALALHHINPDGYVLFWDLLFFGLGLALVAVGAGLVHRVRMEARSDGVTPAG